MGVCVCMCSVRCVTLREVLGKGAYRSGLTYVDANEDVRCVQHSWAFRDSVLRFSMQLEIFKVVRFDMDAREYIPNTYVS